MGDIRLAFVSVILSALVVLFGVYIFPDISKK